MSEPGAGRRRRRRSPAESAPARPRGGEPTKPAEAAGPPVGSTPARGSGGSPAKSARRGGGRRARPERDQGESTLRELVGSGPSQLGVSGALRGRDVNRPTEQDLAEAERDLVIVRRNWKPPA